ncbi:MAG: VWA domain-containing protein, partial [Planctomycetes bacterium]|nr:VWA domain-containing protein [Planctomycetota bacterium]
MTTNSTQPAGSTNPGLFITTDSLNLAAGRDNTRHVVLSMTAAEQVVARGNQRAPLNLALVIDDSGSMRGPTLEQAKESARLIIEALDNKDVLSIVTFENKVRTLMLGEEMTAAGKGRAMEQIAAIRARGGTALGGGWLAGLDAVLKSQLRMDGAMNRILLLTDGGGNVG